MKKAARGGLGTRVGKCQQQLDISSIHTQTQAQDDDPLPEVSLPPSSLPPPVPPGGIQLRERMPSQFPTKLAGLEGEQRDGEARLEMVKKGHGLFKLMRDAETDKVGLPVCMTALSQYIFCEIPLPPSAIRGGEDRSVGEGWPV